MSEYRIIHRKQDLELRISSLYRQQQLAIGLLDLGTSEELETSLSWYLENMKVPLYVLTTELRLEDSDILQKYRAATFIVFKNATTTGSYINVLADECNAIYFLVTRTDCTLISYDGKALAELMEDKNHPVMVTPVLISSQGEVMPTLRAPYIRGRDVDPVSFLPDIESAKAVKNLYPVMELGLYDRALFQRLRAYDTQIASEYYQGMDFGVRCHLLGFNILTTRALAFMFPNRISLIEDRSPCDGMNRFYTKALSIRRISGKNVVGKWKPYFDKEVYKEEVKKKKVILQKTDFFTLISSWEETEG